MMNMKYKMIIGFLAFIALIGSAFAVPGVPNQFYGDVRINGNPAPDGTSVTARINGEVAASVTVSDGSYNMKVKDPDNDRGGDTVNFFVDGKDTGVSKSFCNGCSDRVDLSITKETEETGTTESGGGSTGGSSGGAPTSSDTTDSDSGSEDTAQDDDTQETQDSEDTMDSTQTQSQCEEDWRCTDWGKCEDGVQTRDCVDWNECGTEERKPMESQPCVEEEVASQSTAPTGFFAANSTGILAGVAAIIVILATAFYMKRRA